MLNVLNSQPLLLIALVLHFVAVKRPPVDRVLPLLQGHVAAAVMALLLSMGLLHDLLRVVVQAAEVSLDHLIYVVGECRGLLLVIALAYRVRNEFLLHPTLVLACLSGVDLLSALVAFTSHERAEVFSAHFVLPLQVELTFSRDIIVDADVASSRDDVANRPQAGSRALVVEVHALVLVCNRQRCVCFDAELSSGLRVVGLSLLIRVD